MDEKIDKQTVLSTKCAGRLKGPPIKCSGIYKSLLHVQCAREIAGLPEASTLVMGSTFLCASCKDPNSSIQNSTPNDVSSSESLLINVNEPDDHPSHTELSELEFRNIVISKLDEICTTNQSLTREYNDLKIS